MIRYDNSSLVIWIEKVKNYIRVETLFLKDNEEINNAIMVNNVYRLKESEEHFLFFILYYLSDRYGTKKIIQSNYLITDKRIIGNFNLSASKKQHFQNEEIINITDEDINNMLYNTL